MGILAAAGLVALTSGVVRLAEDNRRARDLALRLADVARIAVDLATVQTNIVAVDVSGLGLAPSSSRRGWQIMTCWRTRAAAARVRFVTHRQIGDAEVERAVAAVAAVVAGAAPAATVPA